MTPFLVEQHHSFCLHNTVHAVAFSVMKLSHMALATAAARVAQALLLL